MEVNMTVRIIVAAALSLGATQAFGQSLDSGDTAWMATSTALVLFMTIPGLALFYGGMVRANNVVTMLMQCFSITCVVTILWLIAGYSLAFSDVSLAIVGDLSKFLYNGVGEDVLWGAIPESAFATFQLTFAIITPALVVGAFVERMRLSAVLLFAAFWSLLVYAPVAHWVWGGGWLGNLGFLDFAGGVVVHVSAGTAALVASLVLGPRQGFPHLIPPPHNLTLTVAGAAMLWVGWLGFNGGSAIAANGDATLAIAVTHIAAATAAFTWMVLEWIRNGKPSALGAVTGMVAGLATITPAAGFVGPAGALVIGVLAGGACLGGVRFLKRTLRIDDSLDVVGIHLVGGALGTILASVFSSDALGLLGGQEQIAIPSQLIVQAIGVIAVMLYTGVATWVILAIVNVMVRERVSEEAVLEGLDSVFHDERGYDLDQLHSELIGNDVGVAVRAPKRPPAGGAGQAEDSTESPKSGHGARRARRMRASSTT